MERTSSPDILRRFAEILEREGIDGIPADLLHELLAAGRVVDASAVAMAVVVDPTEPGVARERAFGLLSIQIIGRADRTPVPCQRQRTAATSVRTSSDDRRNRRPATTLTAT